MDDFLHRLAVMVLVISGLLSIALVPWDPVSTESLNYFAGSWLAAQAQHRELILTLLGVSLVISAVVPAVRLASMAASILSKVAFLGLTFANFSQVAALATEAWLEAGMVAALLASAAVFVREARQEARWNGMLPLRSEA